MKNFLKFVLMFLVTSLDEFIVSFVRFKEFFKKNLQFNVMFFLLLVSYK